MKYPNLESRQRLLGRVNAYLPPLHNLPPKILRLVLKSFDKSLGLPKTAMQSVTEHKIPSTIDSELITARAYYLIGPPLKPIVCWFIFMGEGVLSAISTLTIVFVVFWPITADR